MSFKANLKHLSLNLLPNRLLQPLRKAHYARKLNRRVNEPEMSVIPYLLGSGGCALDLGANFGSYTHCLARIVGETGSVYAVEPIRATCEVLQHNISQFGLKNVRVHQVAISDRKDFAPMVIPSYDRGGENFYEARIVSNYEGEFQRTVRVPTRTLDGLFGPLGRIDFVKCDVEGHEINVLRGARAILDVHRPAWMIEVSGNPNDADSSAAEVVKLMSRAGYCMYHLAGVDTKYTANYFFLRPEHVRRLANIVEA